MKRINMMEDKLFEGLFKPPTKEEIEERHNGYRENPENMSFWLPAIENAKQVTGSSFLIPRTKIVQMTTETRSWLETDNYQKEAVEEFNNQLNKELDGFLPEQKLFIKTGIFSNKFEFNKTMVTDRTKIGQQMLDIFYASLVLGAFETMEFVFREFIEDVECNETIYKGMPLKTEFRVFYDFDIQKVIGISNYWNPEVMIKNLVDDSITAVATSRENTKEILEKIISTENFQELKSYQQEDLLNGLAYLKGVDKLEKEYAHYKEFVIREIEALFVNGSYLTGRWSIDVMKNGEDFYVIDMARMNRSSLVEQMEAVNEKESSNKTEE